MIVAFIIVFAFFLIISILSYFFPQVLINGDKIFAVLIFIVLGAAVISFPVFMKKVKQYQWAAAKEYIKDIKAILGEETEYFFEGNVYLKDIYDDPSVTPWYSTSSRSEHMLKGTYETLDYRASNLKTFTGDFINNDSRSYFFDGYYIIADLKNIPSSNVKMHIRTLNYFKLAQDKVDRGPIKYKGRNYDFVNYVDSEFNKKFIVTSDSPAQAEKILLRDKRITDLLMDLYQDLNREFAVFLHGNGAISIAIPDFLTFNFGLTPVKEKEARSVINEDMKQVMKYLDLLYRFKDYLITEVQ